MEETNFFHFWNLYGRTTLDMFDMKDGQIHEKVIEKCLKVPKKGI